MVSDPREMALAAAHQATEAAAELIRFAREGAHFHGPFSADVEVFEKLCDALKMAAEIEAEPDDKTGDVQMDAEYRATRSQVVGAIERHLEGWA